MNLKKNKTNKNTSVESLSLNDQLCNQLSTKIINKDPQYSMNEVYESHDSKNNLSQIIKMNPDSPKKKVNFTSQESKVNRKESVRSIQKVLDYLDGKNKTPKRLKSSSTSNYNLLSEQEEYNKFKKREEEFINQGRNKKDILYLSDNENDRSFIFNKTTKKITSPNINININLTENKYFAQHEKSFVEYDPNKQIETEKINNEFPIKLTNLLVGFPLYDETKTSIKSFGSLKGFSANTYQGLVRNYNEDRVSIIPHISRPSTFKGEYWPTCSFFGIYDGHGGSGCSEYLKDNLHNLIIHDEKFPKFPEEALKSGFENAEKLFIFKRAIDKSGDLFDKSGSCALVALIVDHMLYIANLGDSRATMSKRKGRDVCALSQDHKPYDKFERQRIIKAGGRIYQTQSIQTTSNISGYQNQNINYFNRKSNKNQVIYGPCRVDPGRLSVSRTFGDVQAKYPKFGGMKGVVIATPDVSSHNINHESDFVVLGSDGIYDKLSCEDVAECVWLTTVPSHKTKSVHEQGKIGVDLILKTSLLRNTNDNISCILIMFQGYESLFVENYKKTTNKHKSFCEIANFRGFSFNNNKNEHAHSMDRNQFQEKSMLSEGEGSRNFNSSFLKFKSPKRNITDFNLSVDSNFNEFKNFQNYSDCNEYNDENEYKVFNRQNQILTTEMEKEIKIKPYLDSTMIDIMENKIIIPHINTKTLLINIKTPNDTKNKIYSGENSQYIGNANSLNTNKEPRLKQRKKFIQNNIKSINLPNIMSNNLNEEELIRKNNSRLISTPIKKSSQNIVLNLKENILNERKKINQNAVILEIKKK